jgi:hypothetical protein
MWRRVLAPVLGVPPKALPLVQLRLALLLLLPVLLPVLPPVLLLSLDVGSER